MSVHPSRLIAAAAAVVTLAAGPVAATAAHAAPQSRTPVVLMLASGNPSRVLAQRRPARFNLMVGGPSIWVKPVRWSQWTGLAARGRGPAFGADVTFQHLGRVTLQFSGPRKGRGHLYFSKLHISGGHNIAHYFHWEWSGPNKGWTQNAS